ncbi:MAG TPA: hypothetical protein VLN49_19385 [Gemmatimonadaceae bacterium]|nr:hypothetical protein [Gemmatimonadaceae bacterium]
MSTNAWAAAGALLSLGALHGLNPGMGWRFAVALGVQQGERQAVWRALGPLALGHALAIAVAVAIALGLGVVLPSLGIRWVAAALLVGLGVWQMRGHRHAGLGGWRPGGMRATGRELTAWSFVVATAHGAGLMAAPFALRTMQSGGAGHSGHASHSAAMASMVSVDWPTLWATSVHTAGYLLVTAVLAVVVYERAALHLVRRAWINFDLIWATALVLTGAAVAVV